MNTAQHISAIQDQGYAVIESLLNEHQIIRLRSALDPWLKGKLMGRNNFEGFKSERVYALLAKHNDFAMLVEHPEILAITNQLLERDYLLSANLAINVHPGETPQPFHQDNDGGPFASTGAIHGISVIWNLDEFTEDNGATEVIPGSHHFPNGLPDTESAIKILMPAGSALVFSGSLLHRGGTNRSSKARLAITPQYCQPWLRQLENMVLSVPPEMAALFSPRIQELLGYSVRSPGFMGYVDGLHPKRLFDKNYQGRKAQGKSL